jgi:iron complex transport system substrate-binding protein
MLEWIEPLFDGGHWVPEMMETAGARYNLRSAGETSEVITMERLASEDPDSILIACCGFDLTRNLLDAEKLWKQPLWSP